MNVYHVVNRNKLAKPKIVIENVVSVQIDYYIYEITVFALEFIKIILKLPWPSSALHFDVLRGGTISWWWINDWYFVKHQS